MFGKEKQSPAVVKTKLGGVFTRHKRSLFGSLSRGDSGLSSGNISGKKVSKVQSIANMIESESSEEDDFFEGEMNYNLF